MQGLASSLLLYPINNFSSPVSNRNPFGNQGPVTFHPASSMENGETRTFKVANKYFKQRPGRKVCSMTSKMFTIIRIDGTDTTKYGTVLGSDFYAISGRTDFEELDGGNETHRYESQVAFIRCRYGWIKLVEVFEESLEISMDGFSWRVPENPLGCGIGVVLTELCLADPRLSKFDLTNVARLTIEKESAEAFGLVSGSCHKLVGLFMAADPIKGAGAYFSAAIRMGYGKLIIFKTDRDFNREFNVYETEVARDHFDSNTGIIGPCCGEPERCSTWGENWYFCAEVQKNIKQRT